MAAHSGSDRRDIFAQEGCITGHIHDSGCKIEKGLCGGFLARNTPHSIDFQKQDAKDKARAFVAVKKWMIVDDASV